MNYFMFNYIPKGAKVIAITLLKVKKLINLFILNNFILIIYYFFYLKKIFKFDNYNIFKMIKQIVNNKEEFKSLIINELKNKEVKHINTEKELQYLVENITNNDSPTEYPIFLFADLEYIYKESNISLFSSILFLTKEELAKLLKEL